MKLRNKKTGEIIDVDFGKIYESMKSMRKSYNTAWNQWHKEKYGHTPGCPKPSLKPEDVLEKFGYDTLAELNAEWEDYKPAEPLIKNEKIRKAVRAWAEANGIEEATVTRFTVFDAKGLADIHVYPGVFDDNSYDESRVYTIEELCGEEESIERYAVLKDKNGKEVYKGDIVRFGNEIEIIGNIYENPELLGEDEEC